MLIHFELISPLISGPEITAKAPISKSQITNNNQSPNSNDQILIIGNSDLFDVWCLGLGYWQIIP